MFLLFHIGTKGTIFQNFNINVPFFENFENLLHIGNGNGNYKGSIISFCIFFSKYSLKHKPHILNLKANVPLVPKCELLPQILKVRFQF